MPGEIWSLNCERVVPGCRTRDARWHGLEHEIHHGGELSLALGQHDLPGIYGRL